MKKSNAFFAFFALAAANSANATLVDEVPAHTGIRCEGVRTDTPATNVVVQVTETETDQWTMMVWVGDKLLYTKNVQRVQWPNGSSYFHSEHFINANDVHSSIQLMVFGDNLQTGEFSEVSYVRMIEPVADMTCKSI